MSASGVGRKFHFIREIASGGFGSVYLAKVIHGDGFQRLAAVKLLHPKWSENEEIAARMRDEARLLGWLRHKHIVEVLDLTRIAGRVAVIMEYLDAVDLRVAMQAAAVNETTIPLAAALEICAAVASALDAAYNRPPYVGEKPLRVIHRDIKPSNIMIDTSGTVKVLDFGVARADFAERESRTEEMSFGSVDYMPPERLFFEPDTPTSDVFSLGATLFEMLALEKFGKAKLRASQHDEFFDERWEAVRRNMSFPSVEVEKDVRQLLREMLAFDSHDRPSAADCVLRMRTLSRRAGDAGVGEWAEQVIPPLVQRNNEKKKPASPESLVDKVVSEDNHGLRRDDDTSETFDRPPARTPSKGEDREDLDHSGRLSDQQWQKLKQATLAELEPPAAVARGNARAAMPAAPPKKSDGFAPAKGAAGLAPMKATPGLARPPTQPTLTPSPNPPPPKEPVRRTTPGGTPMHVPAGRKDSEPEPAPVPNKTMMMAPPKRGAPLEESVTSWAPRPQKGQAPTDTPTLTDERTEVPLRRDPEEEPPKKGGSLVMRLLVLFVVATVVLGGGSVLLFGVLGVGGWVYMNQASVAAAPEEVAAETPAPAKVEKAAPAKKITGPHVQFESALAGTKKMQVTCKSGKASGADEVGVAGDKPGDCTVTVVTGDRKTLTAKVKGAKAVNYTCFSGGAKECVEKK